MPARRPTLTAPQRTLVRSILAMYGEGWFPMHDPEAEGGACETGEAGGTGGTVRWVQPHQRGIIPLDGRFRVPRSLRARVRSEKFLVTCDRAFGDVIRACAASAPGREDTWLDDSIIASFELLHRAGHAHSVEAWVTPSRGEARRALGRARKPPPGSRLVGGLYGVRIGSVFCGESMFSRPALGGTDASKVCLVHLVHHLRRRGFTTLDAQLTNPHLEQFGCYELPREEYVRQLSAQRRRRVAWGELDAERTRGEV